jgi:hypothetical protein
MSKNTSGLINDTSSLILHNRTDNTISSGPGIAIA